MPTLVLLIDNISLLADGARIMAEIGCWESKKYQRSRAMKLLHENITFRHKGILENWLKSDDIYTGTIKANATRWFNRPDRPEGDQAPQHVKDPTLFTIDTF